MEIKINMWFKELTNERIKKYILKFHRDIFGWSGMMFRIFLITLQSYLMILFFEQFGNFLQWESEYTKTINLTPIAWLVVMLYFIFKTSAIVVYQHRQMERDEKGEIEDN
jgi:hypothetical protein